MKLFGRGFAGLGLILAGILLTGCQSQDNYKFANDPLAPASAPSTVGATTASTAPASPADISAMTIAKGNSLTFTFSDTPNIPAPIDTTVQDDGSLTLLYNERFQADGKTVGALQGEVRDRYVPKFFKYLTVTIKIQERWYFVGGEVKAPGRQIYSGRINLLQALDTAGGFTDFSRKGKVQVTRANGEIFYVDCVSALRHPDQNREIYPGDKIQVNRRIW